MYFPKIRRSVGRVTPALLLNYSGGNCYSTLSRILRKCPRVSTRGTEFTAKPEKLTRNRDDGMRPLIYTLYRV